MVMSFERHDPSEHAPVDSLLVTLRQVLVDGGTDDVDGVSALGGHRRKPLFHGECWTFFHHSLLHVLFGRLTTPVRSAADLVHAPD
jgi:hypothetical protein